MEPMERFNLASDRGCNFKASISEAWLSSPQVSQNAGADSYNSHTHASRPGKLDGWHWSVRPTLDSDGLHL
jgi:hypothetical protein